MDPVFFSTVNSFAQAIVYGIYITTLAHCMRWLVYNDEGLKRREKMNVPLLIASVAVFLLQTAGLATSFQTTLELSNSPSFYQFELVNTINSAVEFITLQIVDAVLICRCWAVYARSWRIICLPLLCWVSNVALSIYYFYLSSVRLHVTDTSDKLGVLTLKIWDAFYAFNIVINVYATVAIVYRIFCATKNSGYSSRNLSQTLRIIAESGALYTLSTILNLLATVLVSQSESYQLFQVIADPINFSMAGIAFNLILIRVGQQRGATSRGLSANWQFADKGSRWLSAIRFHEKTTTTTETSPPQQPSTLVSSAEYNENA